MLSLATDGEHLVDDVERTMAMTTRFKSHSEQQDEPRCLVPRTAKWYRPGQGFTCRQIMLPLIGIAVLLLSMAAISWVSVGSANRGWYILQLVLLACALGLVGRSLYFVRRSLLGPLTEVRQWVSRMRNGDLAARVPDLPGGEFAELARDINGLAAAFQTLSMDMESEVQAQTERLAQKTRSLEFLYDIAASINRAHDLNELLTRLMHTVQEMVDASAATLRTLTADGKFELVANVGISGEFSESQRVLSLGDCLRGQVIAESEVNVPDTHTASAVNGPSFAETSGLKMIAVPFQYRNQMLGIYNLFVSPGGPAARTDIQEVLTSTGRHLGIAIEQARLAADAERLSLMEERTRLAHELHDSLAQTLASLRFQIRVLDDTLHQGDESLIWQQMEEIETSVDEANTELRELIARFRPRTGEQGFTPAIEKLVSRFRKEEDIPIFLQNEWGKDNLPPEMQIEVVRIVQEALANVRKHSRATAVRIMMRHDDGLYRVLIEDDGIGFEDRRLFHKPGEHIGLTIMQERAQRLGGDLRVESEPGEGTRVTLTLEYPTQSGGEDLLRKGALG